MPWYAMPLGWAHLRNFRYNDNVDDHEDRYGDDDDDRCNDDDDLMMTTMMIIPNDHRVIFV